MDFVTFKSCQPVLRAFRGMKLSAALEEAQGWDHLRRLLTYEENDTKYVVAVRHYHDICSSGERVLLHAVLYATDFAWLADELDDGHTWRRFAYVSGAHRDAVIACLRLID